MQALQDKRSIIVKAEGEALSAKLVSEAIGKNPVFIQLRYATFNRSWSLLWSVHVVITLNRQLEAAREIATIVSRSQNRVYLNADALLFTQTSLEESALSPK